MALSPFTVFDDFEAARMVDPVLEAATWSREYGDRVMMDYQHTSHMLMLPMVVDARRQHSVTKLLHRTVPATSGALFGEMIPISIFSLT